jgi:prepilin peptidase CpaA
MFAELLVIAILPALLMLAAGWDLASFSIPNFIPLALLLTFALFALGTGLSSYLVVGHLLIGLIGLVIGFILFATGIVGGGDAKLFATTLVWLGLKDALDYTLIAALLGGALTIVLLLVRGIPLPAIFLKQAWIARLCDTKAGVPYGVALALGAILVLPYTEVFHATGLV